LKLIYFLKIIPLLISAVLFVAAYLLENISIETRQPNGLPEIQFPYSSDVVIVQMAATSLLIFGLAFKIAIRGREKTANTLSRVVIGSAVFGFGLTIFLFSALFLWELDTDYLVRCEGGCALSLVQSHLLNVKLFSGAIAAGLILTATGLWLTIRARTDRKNSSSEPRVVDRRFIPNDSIVS